VCLNILFHVPGIYLTTNTRVTNGKEFRRTIKNVPITVPAQSKAQTAFARSNARIVGSNPTQGIYVLCAYCLEVEALCWADPPSKSPTDCV
jgi:hypothetical protein